MLLGVNIDHVATLRNARGGFEPDVYEAIHCAMQSGADSITMHLREDRRHIKDEDLRKAASIDNIKINLEMAATPEMQEKALKLKPYACCLVPEKRQELTTEGGLNAAGQREKLISFVGPLLEKGINVSLFIDPDFEQVEASAATGAKYIELHTGRYSNAFGTDRENEEFKMLKTATSFAQSLGLTVNAGHGLNYENVSRMHKISGLYELNIGHSIIARAVFKGLSQAVIDMKQLVI